MGDWELSCGEIITSSTAGDYIIISDKGFKDVIVEFLETASIVVTSRDSARRGRVKDPYKPTVEGVGYLGEGPYKVRYGNCPKVKEYTTWRSMLARCYSELDQPNNRNYKGVVTVCSEWHNFQTYSKWFHANYVEGWELDKDFLNPEADVYSPENCVFLPPRLNKLLIGKSRESEKGFPTGISTMRRSSKFAARLSKAGEREYLGCYETMEEAGEVYRKAKDKYLVELFEPYLKTLDKRVVEKVGEIKASLDDKL